MSSSWFQAVSNGAAVVLVLALLLLTVWVLRKKGLANFAAGSLMNQRQRRLSVVETARFESSTLSLFGSDDRPRLAARLLARRHQSY